ncbi:MAG: divergent polysaccharide deacetylase family protein [Desulfobacterales bacterium]|nr:divergent polysaccharide deacetylase family protein [Desulfobacterales bacterium]MDJ0874339.1 divergent polysaccharide deacetylase family protein [Desulfobacterales bacterium]MDJ0883285.1 divergent polysaccharide deacetylase family protein [Desulfobacterales bacterium]
MHRRVFLRTALQWALTGWLGLNGIPKANAASPYVFRRSPRIALIIDDIGFSRRIARQFMDIPAALTYAVLPHLPFSHQLAQEIHANGCEILLHQPMEPFDAQFSPGPGAIYVGDSAERIDTVVGANIQAVPHAIGVNNHMGSRLTTSTPEILAALRTIKREGLFFVDSLTSHRSRAFVTARRINMNAGRRDAFLDTSRHPNAIINRLYQLVNRALHTGTAIGIGHPFPETAVAINQFCAEIEGSGVEIASISSVLNSV